MENSNTGITQPSSRALTVTHGFDFSKLQEGDILEVNPMHMIEIAGSPANFLDAISEAAKRHGLNWECWVEHEFGNIRMKFWK
jgi:hypothetical protein